MFTRVNCIYQHPGLVESVPGGTEVKNSPVNAREAKDTGLIPGSGRYLEKEMATRSSTLAWEIPWTGEPGGLQSTGSQRVRDDWALMRHTLAQAGWTPLYLGWQIENEIEYEVENNTKIKAKRNQSRIHFKISRLKKYLLNMKSHGLIKCRLQLDLKFSNWQWEMENLIIYFNIWSHAVAWRASLKPQILRTCSLHILIQQIWGKAWDCALWKFSLVIVILIWSLLSYIINGNLKINQLFRKCSATSETKNKT